MTVTEILEADHRRLEALLDRAGGEDGAIDLPSYAEFRRGLLRHIGMEEKILVPAAREARGGEPLAVAETLRLQHGAIAALLVPSPRPAILRALRDILRRHNTLEEGPGALYETCDRILGERLTGITARLTAAPAVPVAKHVDGPLVEQALRRALARAGFELDEP